MSASASDDAAAFCANLVRSHDFARYAATLFVPVEARRALLALYAFNAEISRIRDQVSQPLPGEVRMQWWSDMLAGTAHGGIEGNPVAAELLAAIRHYHLPVDPLSRLIEEHQFDLYNDPMPSMAALEGYVTDTASALFMLAGEIFARPSEPLRHLARHAGLAQGLTQVIVDLPRDAAHRQLFLPLQVLQSHGSGVEEVFSGKQRPAVRAAVDHIIAEAQRHLKTAFNLLGDVPAEVRPAFLPLAVVRRDLARLARADNDPFTPYVASRFSTLWTLWRATRSHTFKGG